MNSTEAPFNLTCHPSLAGYRYFGAAMGVLLTVVGTLGNVMTILAFATDKKIRSKFNLLILNLTLSDLLYCTFLQPVTVDSYLHLAWTQGITMCRVFGLLLFVSNSVSIFNLILIAASRYLLIAKPRSFDRVFSRYTLPAFLAGPWLLGFALFGPLWYAYQLVENVCTCSFNRTKGRPYTTILMFVLFGLGLSSIGVFYFLIHRKVKAAAEALAVHRLRVDSKRKPGLSEQFPTNSTAVSVVSHSIGGSEITTEEVTKEVKMAVAKEVKTDEERGPGQEASGSKDATKVTASHHNKKHSSNAEFKKVTRMCFAMFLVFLACYLPFCVLNIADGKERAPPLVHMIAANFTWFNSCLNPVLYAVMNRQFRDAYRGVLAKAAIGLRDVKRHHCFSKR
uniref:G-protein coupled receptors family 1 profile domain-containing protein n=1 Tax=Callorhinchus milii TaxID=7868 RepID=A0A4W3GNJ0_CALMI